MKVTKQNQNYKAAAANNKKLVTGKRYYNINIKAINNVQKKLTIAGNKKQKV